MDNGRKIPAISILVQNKTDSELLDAIVAALTVDDGILIDKLMAATNYDQLSATNVQIVGAIVAVVQERRKGV